MQRCRSRRKRLQAYLDGALPSHQVSWLEAHLHTCQACQAAMERRQRVSDILQCLRSPDRPEAYWEQQILRFRRHIRGLEETRQPQRMWAWRRVFAWPMQTLTPALALLCIATIQVIDLLGLEGQAVDLYQWWLLVLLGP